MKRPKENFVPFFSVGLGLTISILVIFQAYMLREPTRIRADEAADLAAVVAAGEELFAENCVACHGENGQGGIGPALNSRPLLESVSDEALFNLTRIGIPGTLMPAWGQAFGGPLTDEQVGQLVAFIRSWEPTAPEPTPVVLAPDPARGAAIYARTCFVCHGENAEGTELAPALRDSERLSELDDAWYRGVIARGRPAKGMPTWGTVLSPDQINDLVALIAAWRQGKDVAVDIPLAQYIGNTLFAVREFDTIDAAFYLEAALEQAEGEQARKIRQIISLVDQNRLFEAEAALLVLLPPEEMGAAVFESSCAACHGSDGTGGLGPNLHANAFIQAKSDQELVDFFLAGRSGTPMVGFEGILTEEQLLNLIQLLRGWQQ